MGKTREEQMQALGTMVSSMLAEMINKPDGKEELFGGTASRGTEDVFSGAEGVTPEFMGTENVHPVQPAEPVKPIDTPVSVEEALKEAYSDSKSNVIKFPNRFTEEEVKAIDDAKKTDTFLSQLQDSVVHKVLPYLSKRVKQHEKNAYADARTDRHSNTVYAKDTCMSCGEPVTFQRVMQIPDWGMEFKDNTDNGSRAENLDKLRVRITECIGRYFGGWNRVNTIIVSGYQLIVNGICYMPKLDGATIEKFPFDSADYIKNGCIAPFLYWGVLNKCNNLRKLSFDDVDFVTGYVRTDLGCGRDTFNEEVLFRICGNLEVLDIGGRVVTYEELNAPEDNTSFNSDSMRERRANSVREKLNESMENSRFYEGYKSFVCDSAGNVRKWGVNNLVNYANNRGDKNLFWYTGGILSRATIATMFAVGEGATRITGGIAHGIASAFRSARR